MNTIPKIILDCQHDHPVVSACEVSVNPTRSRLIVRFGWYREFVAEFVPVAGIEPVVIAVEEFDGEELSRPFYCEQLGWNLGELPALVNYLRSSYEETA